MFLIISVDEKTAGFIDRQAEQEGVGRVQWIEEYLKTTAVVVDENLTAWEPTEGMKGYD